MDLPNHYDLMTPVIEALKAAGGSGRRNEIIKDVIDRERFSDRQLDVCNSAGSPVIVDRIGWALSYLKKIGAVDNSQRGVWSLTADGHRMDAEEVAQRYRDIRSEISAHYKERKQRRTARAVWDTTGSTDDEDDLGAVAGADDEDEGADVEDQEVDVENGELEASDASSSAGDVC